MEQKNVLVQVIFPSVGVDLMCIPAVVLHDCDLLFMKTRGFYLDCEGVYLVEYSRDSNFGAYRRSAMSQVVNGEYVDITL